MSAVEIGVIVGLVAAVCGGLALFLATRYGSSGGHVDSAPAASPAPRPGPPHGPPHGPPPEPPTGERAPPPELRAAQPALPAAPPHMPERRDLAPEAPEARRALPAVSPELRALARDLEAELPAGPVATPAPSSARAAPARHAGKPPKLGPLRWREAPDYAAQARRPAPDADPDGLTVKDEAGASALRAFIERGTANPPPVIVPPDEAALRAAHLCNRAAPHANDAPASGLKSRVKTLLGFGDIPAKQPTSQPAPPATLPPPSSEVAPRKPPSIFDPLDEEGEEVTCLITKDGKRVEPAPAKPAPGSCTESGTLVSFTVLAPAAFGAERKRG
jgi:hypothetical protein